MKKLLSALIVCIMAFGCAVAVAEYHDSKSEYIPAVITKPDNITVKGFDELDKKTQEEMSELTEAVITDLVMFSDDLGKVFGDENMTAVKDILGLTDDAMISIDDIQPVVFGNDWDGEAVEISFALGEKEYEKGQPVALMIGIPSNSKPNSEMQWIPVEGKANDDGGVKVIIPVDIMEKITKAGGRTVIAFASEVAPAESK